MCRRLFGLKELSMTIKKWLTAIGLNILLIGFGVELLAVGYFYVQENALFYSTESRNDTYLNPSLSLLGIRKASQHDKQSVWERLHPFFGYILRQNAFQLDQHSLGVNNHGFFAQHDYPFVKASDNQFIVGVFGGSVANDVAVRAITHVASGQFGLINHLKRIPHLKNRDIVILNFANGGYKQPQQLLILTTMLALGQTFDLVLNIDGFNEAALSTSNREFELAPVMPSLQHVKPLLDMSGEMKFDAMEDLLSAKRHVDAIREHTDNIESCVSATCYLLNGLKKRFHILQFRQYSVNPQAKSIQEMMMASDSALQMTLDSSNPTAQQFAQSVASLWVETSKQMDELVRGRAGTYLHVLQPNQYFPTQRQFSAIELRDFIYEEHTYKRGVELVYPALRKAIPKLLDKHIYITDATALFDATTETVYRDACCHYNESGQAILDEFIADTLIQLPMAGAMPPAH